MNHKPRTALSLGGNQPGGAPPQHPAVPGAHRPAPEAHGRGQGQRLRPRPRRGRPARLSRAAPIGSASIRSRRDCASGASASGPRSSSWAMSRSTGWRRRSPPTCASWSTIRRPSTGLAEVVRRTGKEARLHIKLETGTNRQGVTGPAAPPVRPADPAGGRAWSSRG